ncbi:DUF1365 domain-containing protein [Chitinimonas sp. BJYL2]|uniref:DUF1365 domain-containing protein n=1 Tax=Chitinimonas sp. BJYL2 TaxID=2976696 RepID=UPI0022B3426B|nr:DUF1365 domain-containing protein [Chitinimonas sp. BJYL2]
MTDITQNASRNVPPAQLCVGTVMHARSRPRLNRFSYPVFFLRLRLDQLDTQVRSGSWWFGINRLAAVSFQAADHGARDGSDLLAWLDTRLAAAGLQRPGGAVWLHAFPRVLGYAFKPVSFWYCHDHDAQLRIVIAEVNNTFGERHQYVLTAPDQGPITATTILRCRKVFHVSPFCEVRGNYRFRLLSGSERHVMVIDYHDDASDPLPLLKTAMWGSAQAISRPLVLATLLRMPLLTFGVVARIHWQALRLWLGGVPFFRKPQPPAFELTHNNEVSP